MFNKARHSCPFFLGEELYLFCILDLLREKNAYTFSISLAGEVLDSDLVGELSDPSLTGEALDPDLEVSESDAELDGESDAELSDAELSGAEDSSVAEVSDFEEER